MSTSTRISRIIATRALIIAAVLAIAGLLALGGAWSTYSTPPVEQVSEQINRQSVSTDVDTRAVVTGNSSLYEPGELLRNKPVYFLRASPQMTLVVNTSVPDGQLATVTQQVTLEYVATRSGEPFWESTRDLLAVERQTRTGLVSSEATLNLTRINQEVARLRSEVGGVGTLTTRLRVVVGYETNRYSGQLTGTSSVVLTGQAYWLGADISTGRSHSETVTRTVRGTADPVSYLGLAALGVLLLLGAVGVMLASRELDPKELQTKLYRSRYDEWISAGEFPTGTNKKYVRINSLEDLVDIAIDSNKRVVFDDDYDVYAVIDSDIIYYFSTDPAQVDAWLDI